MKVTGGFAGWPPPLCADANPAVNIVAANTTLARRRAISISPTCCSPRVLGWLMLSALPDPVNSRAEPALTLNQEVEIGAASRAAIDDAERDEPQHAVDLGFDLGIADRGLQPLQDPARQRGCRDRGGPLTTLDPGNRATHRLQAERPSRTAAAGGPGELSARAARRVNGQAATPSTEMPAEYA